ncbi:hypothetical protein [Deinococcus pimensis]|uniref:hypothetical protein n=1 Tax=Deinococcus pimensis TaxID=309888 RepID=UPI0004816680|nr:hypothetical protein [Deinococcus pimensis]
MHHPTRNSITKLLAALVTTAGLALADVVWVTAPGGTTVRAEIRQTSAFRVRSFDVTTRDGSPPDPAVVSALREEIAGTFTDVTAALQRKPVRVTSVTTRVKQTPGQEPVLVSTVERPGLTATTFQQVVRADGRLDTTFVSGRTPKSIVSSYSNGGRIDLLTDMPSVYHRDLTAGDAWELPRAFVPLGLPFEYLAFKRPAELQPNVGSQSRVTFRGRDERGRAVFELTQTGVLAEWAQTGAMLPSRDLAGLPVTRRGLVRYRPDGLLDGYELSVTVTSREEGDRDVGGRAYHWVMELDAVSTDTCTTGTP